MIRNIPALTWKITPQHGDRQKCEHVAEHADPLGKPQVQQTAVLEKIEPKMAHGVAPVLRDGPSFLIRNSM